MTLRTDMVCWECSTDMEPEKRVGLYLKFYCPKCEGEKGEDSSDTDEADEDVSDNDSWFSKVTLTPGETLVGLTREELNQAVAALRAAIAIHRLIGTGRSETISNIQHVESTLEKLYKALRSVE